MDIFFKVSKERGEQLAVEYGIKFMETSAKASVNVEEAFHTLARDIKTKTEKKLVSLLKLKYYNLYLFFFRIISLYYLTNSIVYIMFIFAVFKKKYLIHWLLLSTSDYLYGFI